MSNRKSTKKRSGKRRRKGKSKAEQVFGAIVIEGLGVLAILVMFVFARQASEPAVPAMADTQVGVVAGMDVQDHVGVHSTPLEWRVPDSGRFQRSWNQVGAR